MRLDTCVLTASRHLRALAAAVLLLVCVAPLAHGQAVGAWSSAPSLPTAVQEVSVTVIDGLVYVAGGSAHQSRVNTLYVFDPVSQVWSARAPYPGTPRDHIGIASVGGLLYLFGGVTDWPAPSVDTVQRYDPATDSWSLAAPLPAPRGAMAVAALNGKVYAAGGLVDGQAVSDFTVYDPATNTWQLLPPMPTPRDHAVGTALGGKFYVTGGRTFDHCEPLTTVEIFDPVTGTWAPAPAMMNARGGHGAAALNGKLYVFGGEGAPGTCGAIGSTEQYDPSTGSWSPLPSMPTPRHGTGGGVIGTTIYVPGGGTDHGDAPTDVMEKLVLGAATGLPPPWVSGDIGSVGVSGSASATGGVFTVAGAGADIWDSADGFHFVHQPLTGDGQITVRVASLQYTHVYAKAGVMVRQALTPGSPHVILDLIPDGWVEFMSRDSAGGATTYHGGTALPFPGWLRLARAGNVFTASTSATGATWTVLGSVSVPMPSTVYVGLPVTSHDTSVLTTATFDNLSVSSMGPGNQPPAVAITVPASGAVFTAPATIAITATASDADGTVTAVEFFANGTSLGVDATSPYGVTWTQAPAGTYHLTAVATDSGGAQTQSASVTVTVGSGGTPLPPPWVSGDIGSVGVSGSATAAGGVFTVAGAGADIWDSADGFHFVHQPLTGDGQITVRVASLQYTHVYAKAGVMVRQALTPGSPHVILDLVPDGWVEFMSRGSAGGATTYHGGTALPFPGWLRLARAGNVFTASTSATGATWTVLGSVSVPMPSTVYVGLPVTSHDNSVLTTATFDSVSVSTGAQPPPPPPPPPPSGSISFALKELAVGGSTTGTAVGIDGFFGPTSLQHGPDGRLYVSTVDGRIYILSLDQAALTSPNQPAVTAVQQIDDIFLKPSRTCYIGGEPYNCQYESAVGAGRLVTGLLIDPSSTAQDITLYVSNSGLGRWMADIALDTYSGTVTRLRFQGNPSAPNAPLQVVEHVDLVVGLPRSREVHTVNGMAVGPDGWLYITVGGHTNAGQPSEFFAHLPEYYLSASVVRLNLAAVTGMAGPLDVSHVTAASDLVPLSGVFELYSTGYRNAYDLTWHSNGKLYLNDNAGNLGQGNTPGAADGCPTPSIPSGNRPDTLHLVTPGGYGGHPNPARGECVFQNGSLYSPPLAPHGAYVPPLLEYAQGESTNGIVEYTSDAFGGAMKGNLISATFAGNLNVRRVILNESGTAVVQEQNLALFVEPLDVDTDPAGNIYVADYGASRITLMLPTELGTCPIPGSDPATTDSDGDGYTDADEQANNTDMCSPASKPPDFDGDFISDLNDPDDDNDGIPDVEDQLSFDALNGAGTALPLTFEYNPNSPPAGHVANSGFTGVQIASSGVRLLASSIKAGDAGGHMTISTHAGTAVGAANNQVNGLQIGFDSTSSFRIWTRIVQPLTNTPPAQGHAGGIFFGPDEDNFIRLAVVGTASGTIAVQAGLEIDGGFTVVGSIGVTHPVSQLDLILLAHPSATTVSAYLDINASGTLVPVATGVSVPAGWFSNNVGAAHSTSIAGLMTSHGQAVPTAFGFDFFRIDRNVGGLAAGPSLVATPRAHARSAPPAGLSGRRVADDAGIQWRSRTLSPCGSGACLGCCMALVIGRIATSEPSRPAPVI